MPKEARQTRTYRVRPRRASKYLPSDVPPWQEFMRPPSKGTSKLGALWRLFWLPCNAILFTLRKLPVIIFIPIKIFLSLSFVLLLFGLIVAGIYFVKASRADVAQVLRMPERTMVLDRHGAEIGRLHGENRLRIKNLREEVPQYFIDALIIQEDRSFFTHFGIDYKGVGRAVLQVFKHGRATQGASTLTMQLAKNTFQHYERNLDAKLTEVFLARRIESTYDKETILTCYVNRIFWGHTFLGLKQAAYGYFAKQPSELTLGEAALLAGIVCNPNEFSPHRNLEAAIIQRDKVLDLMLRFGKITQQAHQAAIAESVIPRWPERPADSNYALDTIRAELDTILASLEGTQLNMRDEALYSGGLVVRTSLDLNLQNASLEAMNRFLSEEIESRQGYPHETRAAYQQKIAKLLAEGHDEAKLPSPSYLQAATVIIHHGTGAILAIVGGRDSKESPFNRATQSRRQVGSLFKPLVYASYFEQGGSPDSLISDNRIARGEVKGAASWSPQNADGRYLGMKSAGWGLLKSRNTMSVRVGMRVGLKKIIHNATLAGFRQTANSYMGPTIYLGTWEASPLEVASSYSCFPNGGVRPSPYIIESITDKTGRVLWQREPSQTRVFAQKANEATCRVMQQITDVGGTAAATKRLGYTAPSGGKTGTTNAYRNAWFCGFSSDLTAVVWVGFDRQKTIMEKGYGSVLALPIWVETMKAASALHYPAKEIRYQVAQSQTQVTQRLCRVSGHLAHEGCELEHTAYNENLKSSEELLPLCTAHGIVAEAEIEAVVSEQATDEIIAVPEGEYTPSLD